MSEVYVMVTICSRKNMPRFVDCYKDYNVEAANISLGRGTAQVMYLIYWDLRMTRRVSICHLLQRIHGRMLRRGFRVS